MEIGYDVSLKDWYREGRERDKALEDWERNATIKRCSCGNAYSYGYFPVYDDPGACQACRGVEGDLIL